MTTVYQGRKMIRSGPYREETYVDLECSMKLQNIFNVTLASYKTLQTESEAVPEVLGEAVREY